MTKYTDKMIAELREVSGLNYDSATAFANKHGIGVRSVIAKARALDIPYQAKDPKQRKAGVKVAVRAKSDIVTGIETAIGTKLASLSKMTVADLVELERFVVSD